MLNLTACRMKTARAIAAAPCYGKSCRDKGLMQGHHAR